MSEEDSDLQRLVQLGQSLLEQSLDSTNEGESRDSFSDAVYIHTIQLSALLKSMQILNVSDAVLSEPEVLNIQKKLRAVLDDLEQSDKFPSPEIGTGSSLHEAYRVLCFTLLVLQKAPIPNDSQIAAENRALREKLTQFAPLIEYLQSEFYISNDTIPEILSELKKRRQNEHIPRVIPDDTDLQMKLSNLMRQNQNLELQIALVNREKEELSATLSENMQITEEFSRRFQEMQLELEQKDSSSDVNSAQCLILETDLEAANVRCKELQGERDKLKEKLKELRKHVRNIECENKAKDAEIEQLKIQNERLNIERDELQNKATEPKETQEKEREIMEKEVAKLNEALKEIASEMEVVSDELASESKLKTQLFSIVQTQSDALSIAESELKKAKSALDEQILQTKSANSAKVALERQLQASKCNHQEVIDAIATFVHHKNLASPELLDILDSEEMSAPVKCVAIIEFLTKSKTDQSNSNTNEKLKEQNKRLITYISTVMHFIDQLANSKDIQTWMIDAGYGDDCQNTLVQQCGRIDCFLRQNQLLVDTQPVCSTFSQFPVYLKEKLNDIATEDRELLLILQIVCCANEILRKFGDHLVEQVNHMATDMSRLRHEIRQTNEDTDDRIYEATESISRKLAEEQEKNRRIETVLQKIAAHLKTCEGTKGIIKCLRILDDINDDNTEIEDFGSELQQTIDERDAAVEENTAMAKELHKRKQVVKRLGNEVVRMETEIKDITTELEEKRALSESLSTQVMELENENDELRQTIQHQMEELDKSKEDTHSSLCALSEKYEEKIEKLKAEFNVEREEYETEINALKKESKAQRRESREQLQKLQNECQLQTQRNDELRNHFEPMLSDLREKLKEARTAEAAAQTEMKKSELAAKEMKSDLSAARIDLKMLRMKLAASEEKIKRERKLLDAQTRMQIMNAQTENQAILDEQKVRLEGEHHSFLLSLIDKLRPFVDHSTLVTDTTVIDILDRAIASIQELTERAHKLSRYQKEIESLREMLGVREISVVPAVTSLSNELQEYRASKQRIAEDQEKAAAMRRKADTCSNNEKLLRDWEQWANRVHCLVADRFCSPKSPKELQNAIEEIVMGSLGQRQMKRRLEILRIEKGLWKSGLVKPKSQTITKGRLTFRVLICVTATIHRLQRVSGHLKCDVLRPGGERDSEGIRTQGFPIVNVL